jgi:PAS domain S-box-containing protein
MNEKEVKVSDVLEGTPGCVCWKDVNGVYLGCNQAEVEMLGLSSPEEMIGKTDYDLPWKDSADALRETDKRIMQAKASEEVTECVTVNGKTLTLLTRKKVICDSENNVVGVIGISVDMTDRKAKEDRRNELKTQWSINNILQHIPVCIYWKDISGVYLGCNQAEAGVLGFESTRDVIGKTDYDLSWKCVAEILRETDKRIVETQKTEEVLEVGRAGSGKEIMMLTRKSPLLDDKGGVLGVIGVSVDITDRKEKEELEIKLRLREELYRITRDVAHDIRSPLAALGAFQYMVTSKLTERENEILDSLKRSMNGIVDKMMKKHKEVKGEENRGMRYIRRARIEENEGIIDVNSSMKEVMERKMYEYNGKNVEMEYEERERLVFIEGERREFERMMSNIINNGIESVVEGKKAEVKVWCERKGEKVEIVVKDNGRGMAQEMAERLMKWEEIGTTKKEGHGIGTQQITGTVKAMNGLLRIESKEDVGTKFILSFDSIRVRQLRN